ncbi:MAG: hypothetical protein K8F54_11715 [Altibacter sp.]|uniref:hypothetical protein n=1 Tax=Altibacter sp. TaxID=2024823 RepID=UPI001D5C146D|nr:hypothetical protein [Altibacter sp.]MBZ0328266.1 hypothetical protein [Altibacter sp.]
MKKIIILLTITYSSLNAQIITKIEGVSLNAPCELEYTRNIGNQNNYSCPYLYNNDEKLDNYSITVTNLQTEMNGLNDSSLNEFKKTFLETIESNSKNNGESPNFILLNNGISAVSSISYLTYGEQEFKNISISFLYRQKSFIVNLTTNNFYRKNEISELADRILIR